MDIDELQTVQSRERQTDSLQQLRDSFYSEASEYIQQLREARDQAAQRADDPWDNPEVNRLSDEIKTAEQTVEAIYDRRVGKVVKKASLAAADMPADEEGLTTEERALFEQLVESIEDNRGHVLDMIAGDVEPAASPVDSSGTERATADTEPAQQSTTERQPAEAVPSQQPDPTGDQQSPEETTVPEADSSVPPESAGSDVSAADVMNTDGGTRTVPAESESATPTDQEPEQPPSGTPSAASDTAGEDTGQSSRVDRQTVKITEDVGEIFGVDEREYDLSTDDVVTLPADNAEPLVQRDAATRLD